MLRQLRNCLLLLLCSVILVVAVSCVKDESPTAKGTFQGDPITLRQTIYTEYTLDPGLISPFSQGYTCVFEHGEYDCVIYVKEDGTLMPKTFSFGYPFTEDGLAMIQTGDRKWAYIDTKGTIIGESSGPIVPNTRCYERNQLFGIQKIDGTVLTQPIFSFVEGLSYDWNYAVLEKGEHKNVMIDPSGNILITLPDDCSGAYKDGDVLRCQFTDEKGDRYQLPVSLTGEKLTTIPYTAIGNFDQGLAPVVKDGKLGMIAADGSVIIEPTLYVDDAPPAYGEGKITAALNGRLVIFEVTRS